MKDLRHIDARRAAGEARVPEDRPEGPLLCHGPDDFFRDGFLEAREERPAVIVVDNAARDGLHGVRPVEGQAPVEDTAEKEIEIGAVGLHV